MKVNVNSENGKMPIQLHIQLDKKNGPGGAIPISAARYP
jgi:hypothetical protein